MTLIILTSTGQVFCRMSLYGNLSDIFLLIWLGLQVLGDKTREVKCYSHPVISRLHTINVFITVDIDPEHLAEVVFFRFSHCTITLLFLPFCTVLSEVTIRT